MKITTIVPVYNSGKYLEKCLMSITSQTFSNIEIILVDDGSSDRSPIICDEYAQKDNRILVIHKNNEGAGAARNEGIKKASGDYIVFIDSDDTIEPDYFELLSHHNEDVVLVDVDRVDKNGQFISKERMSIYSHLSKDIFLRRQMTGRIPWGGVRKCVKRELLCNNEIRYSSSVVGEEAIYSYLLLRYARSIGFIEKTVYHYCQHEDSLSHIGNEDPWGDVAMAMKHQVTAIGDYSIYGNTVNGFIEVAAIVSIYKMALLNSQKIFSKKAVERWAKMISQKDVDIPTDRSNQAISIRVAGLLVRTRLWPLIWGVIHLKKMVTV